MRPASRITQISYSLLIAGAIDRLLFDGRVIDFMNLGIGGLRTGIFNVADVAIVAGLGVMIVDSAKDARKQQLAGTAQDRDCNMFLGTRVRPWAGTVLLSISLTRRRERP